LSLVLAAVVPLGAQPPSEVFIGTAYEVGQKIDLAVGLFDLNSSLEERELARKMRQVLSDDLDFSGFFNLIEVSRHADEFREGFAEKARLSFNRYYLIGTKGLALAQIELSGDQLTLTGRLYDARNGEMVAGKNYRAEKDAWREMVHRFADEIVERFTGIRGISHTHILFLNDVAGNKEVWMTDYDGANARAVTSNASINLSPAWEPGKQGFFFTSYQDGAPDMFRFDLTTGREKKVLGFPGINSAAAVSPDGRRLAVTLSKDGNSEIYVCTTEGKDLLRLTYDPGIDTSPVWSPNGREIAFVSDRSGRPQIYVIDADGLNLRRLTHDGHINDEPCWSPNGDLIAFSSLRWGATDVCLMDVRGRNIRVLTDNRGTNESPSFSPDGFHLAFSSNRLGGIAVHTMDLQGKNVRRVSSLKGSCTQPAWSR
jgi:TolB protein